MPKRALLLDLATGASDPVAGSIASGFAPIPHAALSAAGLEITAPTQPAATGANTVTVTVTGTATTNGTNLRTAYTAAKALTPGGNALSATNRAMVILPVAEYDMGSTTFTLDANFVDLIAQTPVNPITGDSGAHLPEDTDDSTEAVAQSLSEYRPTSTVVKNSTAHNTITQTVADVRLIGFTVANLLAAFDVGENANGSAFVATVTNTASYYGQMYFWSRLGQWFTDGGSTNRAAVAFRGAVSGTWIDCIANNPSWLGGTEIRALRCSRCYSAPHSFAADGGMFASVFLDCHIVGVSSGSSGKSFQGDGLGVIDQDCVFVDCAADDYSFGGYHNEVSGTFIRCTAGDSSFSGTTDALTVAAFMGYAEDCTAGINSFGGYASSLGTPGEFRGVAIRCTAAANGSFGMPATGTAPLGIIGGLLLQCQLTAGSWSEPNVPGALQLGCVNADGTVVTRQFFGAPPIIFPVGGPSGPINNSRRGALIAGERAISDPQVTPVSVIIPILVSPGGTPGQLYIDEGTIDIGSFTIKSTSASDTSEVSYILGRAS